MSFTYDIESADATKLALSKIRLELGDNVANFGVKPDGSNFEDAELRYWLNEEGGDIPRAVGRACDALAKLWTNVANITVGPRREELGTVAAGWEKRARQSLPEGSGSNYEVRVVQLNHTQDPYKFRPAEDESGI